MKKRFMLILAMMFLFAGEAYAASAGVDPFGNPIDWDTGGYGQEDEAGNETVEDGEIPDISFQEQVEVLGQMESIAAETTVPEETGYVTVRLEETPESWDEGNIELALYCGNRKETVWLYRQAGWVAQTTLPAGKYTFFEAESTGGSSFKPDTGTFIVSAAAPVSISLTPGTVTPIVVVPADEPTEALPEPDAATDGQGVNAIWLIAGGALVIILILGGLVYLGRRRRDGISYRNDILDR